MNIKDEAELGLGIIFCSASPDFGLCGQLSSYIWGEKKKTGEYSVLRTTNLEALRKE